MQSLWRNGHPMCVREILDDLGTENPWSIHTVISFLKRMEGKGAVKVHEGRPIRYAPLLDRETAVQEETNALLDRVYGGEKLLMIQCAVNSSPLTEEDREELIAILKGERR